MRELPDESVDLIIADPPYFEMVDAEWDNQWRTPEEFYEWCALWIAESKRVLKKTGSLYIYGGAPHIFRINTLTMDTGLVFRNAIVWYFATGMGGTKKFRIEHENLLYFTKSDRYTFNADDVRVPYESAKPGGGRTHHPLGKTCGTVWRFSRVQRNAKEFTGHKTQKPLELGERIIKASSNENDIVYIPFAGSGSEIEACLKHNRRWVATELEMEYIDAMIKPRTELMMSKHLAAVGLQTE